MAFMLLSQYGALVVKGEERHFSIASGGDKSCVEMSHNLMSVILLMRPPFLIEVHFYISIRRDHRDIWEK